MTQLCCYRVWDGSLERFKRGVLILAVVDLLIISAVITYTGISLYQVSFEDPPTDPRIRLLSPSDDNGTEIAAAAFSSAENETRLCENGETEEGGDCLLENGDMSAKLSNETQTARFFPTTPYFQVVGYQIANSIQLIIYTVQLFATVVLVRGLLRTDTQRMRTWLIVTEVITTIILLMLVIHLFGDFKGITVMILAAYLIYQFILIRAVSRLIRRTEIELTQFGSVIEF